MRSPSVALGVSCDSARPNFLFNRTSSSFAGSRLLTRALGSSGKIVEPRRQSHRVARRKLHTARWHLPVSQCFTLVSTSEPAERVSAFRRRCLRPRRTDGQVVAIFHIRTRILSGQAMVVCQASRLSRRRVGTIKLAGLDSRTLGAPRCKLNMRLPVSKPLAGA